MEIKYKKNGQIAKVSINFEVPLEVLEYWQKTVKEGLDAFAQKKEKKEMYSKTLIELMGNLDVDATDYSNLLMIFVADLVQMSVKTVVEVDGMFDYLSSQERDKIVDDIAVSNLVLSLIEVLKYKGYEITEEDNQNKLEA